MAPINIQLFLASVLLTSSSVLALPTLTPRASIASITSAQWTQLNQTVGGRLFKVIPLAEPCYSVYNGKLVAPNLAQCAAVQNGYTTDTYLASSYSGFMNPNFAACMSSGQSCGLDSSLPQNPLVYAPPNQCYQGNLANYYIDVRQPSDIQAGLAFANSTGIPLTIKNSGHDYKGRSAGAGSLALWTHNLQPPITLTKGFVPDGCSASVGDAVTVGAGQGFKGVYEFAEANGITVVGGSSPTVGIAGGWITGGGHSAMSNTLGLGIDNVMQIKSVLPNGTLVTANKCQNQDIFFALRGGGGSTFGVIYEMQTRANPRVTLQVAYIRLLSLSPTSLHDFISLCVQNANKWASEGWGGYIVPGAMGSQASGFVLFTPSLNLTAARASMKPLTDFANSLGTIPLNNSVETEPSFYQAYQKYLVPNEEKVGISLALGSRLFQKSAFEGAANQKASTDTLVSVSQQLSFPTGTLNPLVFGYGAPFQILVTAPSSYKLPAEGDTSAVTPAWRNAVWHVIAGVGISNQASPADYSAAFKKAHALADSMTSAAGTVAAYQNEADTFQTNYQESFWGAANYAKLSKIKAQVDPGNLLTCHQCIGWKAADARYGCYPSVS